MAAEMLTVDWRRRRCPRRHLVWLCQSRSLRGRGLQFHRQEGGRGPSDGEPCLLNWREANLLEQKGQVGRPASELLGYLDIVFPSVLQ